LPPFWVTRVIGNWVPRADRFSIPTPPKKGVTKTL
jgi:hypothetical protein